MSKVLEDIESKLPSMVTDLSDLELEDLVDRLERMGAFLRDERQLRRREKVWSKKMEDVDEHVIPTEVLRQILPYLSASETGRLFLLCDKSMLKRVGCETVWISIYQTMWTTTNQCDNGFSRNHWNRLVAGVIGSYEILFRQRLKSIKLAQENLSPLPAVNAEGEVSTFGTNKVIMMVDVWRGSPRQLVISETICNLDELWEQASTTISISAPVEVAKLPRQKAHGWDVPSFFSSDCDGHARLQLFRLHHSQDVSSSVATTNAPVLLDTHFSWWRPWPKHGEVTFLQRERNVGLQLTDRGQWIQHRIVQCRHPRWMSYVGLQFKIVLICEQLPSNPEDDFVVYAFTKVRIEAIRLHENADGNIHHHIFSKDDGWKKHGVTLAHLVEEIE